MKQSWNKHCQNSTMSIDDCRYYGKVFDNYFGMIIELYSVS